MASLPYTPTGLVATTDILYMLRPAEDGSGAYSFLAMDTSQDFSLSNIRNKTLSTTLPFAERGDSVTITPARDGQDSMLVHAGHCTNDGPPSSLWRFTRDRQSRNGNGTWEQLQLSTASNAQGSDLGRANYLAAAVAFSTSSNASNSMYIFGGMCPNSSTSSNSDWTTNASYSNTMLAIEPLDPSSDSLKYETSALAIRGAPVPEAGFTMTPLPPTFPNASSPESQHRNQNFVLVGGHTQQAFLNMSQIALFSLPERTWSFIGVDAPSNPQTDLAIRGASSVDPRSGHTAVLSPDGRKIIIAGGWVGEVSNPASPQLVILDIGSGYGGTGNWQWSIPESSGNGIPSETGIFGHGATMLEGNVMLLTGGFQIGSTGGPKVRRDGVPINQNTYLFNVTSNTWIEDYKDPSQSQQRGKLVGTIQDSSSKAQKAGLGVGLTFGMLAVIAAILVYFWYSRRLQRQREARDDELHNIAAIAHRFHLSAPSQGQLDTREEMSEVRQYNHQPLKPEDREHDGSSSLPQVRSQRTASDAERTGLLYDIPSPTRGLRRSLHSRSTYQPGLRFEDSRTVHGAHPIHPIDERDEYSENGYAENKGQDSENTHRHEYDLVSNVPPLDPFQDPPDNLRTPSPQSPQERAAEVRGWVNDWTAAEAILHRGGRLSPEHTDRTSSTLSDQSARSMLSHSSMQQSAGTLSRALSQRSAHLFTATPLHPVQEPQRLERQLPACRTATRGQQHRRTRSLVLPTDQIWGTAESSPKNATSFTQLQSEGEALLGDGSVSGETSPTKIRRARGWMGSLRRALIGADRSVSSSPDHNRSTSSSPTHRRRGEGDLPRRALSAGGTYWQTRQGAKDWDSEAQRSPVSEDDDWDVETAVERRVVQVMFTVPRERLRVVNQGPEEDASSITGARIDEGVEREPITEEDISSTAENSKGKSKAV